MPNSNASVSFLWFIHGSKEKTRPINREIISKQMTTWQEWIYCACLAEQIYEFSLISVENKGNETKRKAKKSRELQKSWKNKWSIDQQTYRRAETTRRNERGPETETRAKNFFLRCRRNITGICFVVNHSNHCLYLLTFRLAMGPRARETDQALVCSPQFGLRRIIQFGFRLA